MYMLPRCCIVMCADATDSLSCHKLASGKNYREVQDRGSRQIHFYAAPGLCSDQLDMLAGRSKVLNKLLYPSNSNTTVSLVQYETMVEAGLTQADHCAGIASGAATVKGLQGVLMQLLLAVLGALLMLMV